MAGIPEAGGKTSRSSRHTLFRITFARGVTDLFMSLRVRLITSIVIVLLVSLCVGGAVAGWHAVRSVRAEMQAALGVAAQTLRNGIEGLPEARGSDDERGRLVHGFDGDRHVHAELLDAAGHPLVTSRLRALTPYVPPWFVTLLAPALQPQRFDAGAGSTITIEADPRNEISEVWTQLRDGLVATGISYGLTILLVSLVVRRALRPLDRLSSALASLADGQYAVRVRNSGPPELVRLAHGFNAMAERLDAAHARNHRLTEQMLVLQEEERTELARDLHDEVGPFLFAVHLDAASIEQDALLGHAAGVTERARAIREAVGHMQRHVRAMLHRLRPADPTETGLAPALAALVAFWRARQKGTEIVLDVSVDEDTLPDPVVTAVYRLVQEALNNAVRHGRPRRISVTIQTDEDGTIIVRVADDGVGLSTTNPPGFGIKGMRERVEALGGTLHVGPNGDGHGLIVTASLPCALLQEVA